MNVKKLITSLLIMTTATLSLAFPATAKEFTSKDGMISIELDEKVWTDVNALDTDLTVTNKENVIMISKYNKESYPELEPADDTYEHVLQLAYATGEDIYVVTALVDEEKLLPDMYSLLKTVKVKNIKEKKAKNTKKTSAEKAEKAEKETEKIVTEDLASADMIALLKDGGNYKGYTMTIENAERFISAGGGLNLRESFNTDSTVITTVPNGAAVTLGGSILKDGDAIGWSLITYDGHQGFVLSEKLSAEQPYIEEAASSPSDYEEPSYENEDNYDDYVEEEVWE